ncbi:MAG: PD-(D/E)XK nuclease family protein [Candidatus Marinimicrobia bacterium]|nr:PD-(D/E)XK nuclease family protein [Candidatus Neomarinimicrobiota bacterium]
MAKAFQKPLLPYSPNAHLGNVVHECIRLILTNRIRTINAFQNEWDVLIKREEKTLRNNGFEFLIPIKRNVKEYSIKKMQVQAMLTKSSKPLPSVGKGKVDFNHEVWLHSRDGLIVGKADLIKKSDTETKISDFKSGHIFDGDNIKQEYKDQLFLYAYLYNEDQGSPPDVLSVVDLEKKEFVIEFSMEECYATANEAIRLLAEVNLHAMNDHREKLAMPSKSNCQYCSYKPACSYFWRLESDEDDLFLNIRGELLSFREFINGNLTAKLQCEGKEVLIGGIKGLLKEKFTGAVGKNVELFNLKRCEDSTRFNVINTTMLFEASKI